VTAPRVWYAPAALDEAARRAFADIVPYCVAGAAEHRVTAGRRPVVSFVAADPEHVERLLTKAYERVAGPVAVPRTVFDRWDAPAVAQPGAVDTHPVGPGLLVGGPVFARLVRTLDAVFLGLALRAGAVEHSVPALLTWDTLDRAGYPRTFPQHLTTCGVVGDDLEALDRFAAADPTDRAAHVRLAPVCLAPAVCLHLFRRYAGTALDAPFVATATGSCGRYEAASGGSRTRLWSYTMREIVYVGDAPGAERFRRSMLEALEGLAGALGLPCRLVTANDPFFTADRPQRTVYQGRFDVKYELCGRLAADGASLAVASVNIHDQHFGDAFDIRWPDGAPAHSVCLGFGLDRWAHWVHGYAGDDPARWPAPLRA